MMRKLVAVGLVSVALAACASGDQKKSIDRANEGVAALHAKHYDEAVTKLKESADLDKSNYTAWYNLGLAYDAQGKFDDATKAYEEAVKLNGKDAMYHMKLGIARYQSVVAEAKKKAAEDEKKDPTEIDEDTLDLKGGNLDPAMAELQAALSINGGLYRAYYYEGLIYAHTDEAAKAADAWTKSIQSNARYAQPYAALGKLYINWGYYDEALQVLQQGKQNLPGDPQRPVVLYLLGLADYLKKDYGNAVTEFSGALEADKNLHLALYQRGMAYLRNNDLTKAKSDLEQFSKNAKDEYLKGVAQKSLQDIAIKQQ